MTLPKKRALFLHLEITLLIALAVCAGTIVTDAETASSQPKYKIDGRFEDWKGYQVGWQETGLDWSKVDRKPAFEGIDLKEFYYDNDDTYLYLFFKCKRTVEESYNKTHARGALGYLYIDCDMNTNTGAIDQDRVPGADIEIWIPIGFYSDHPAAQGTQSGCFISYEAKRWDASSKMFKQVVCRADSRDPSPLVAHGKDGIEIALLLSEVGVRKGSKVPFVCYDFESPLKYANRTTIEIK